MRRYHLILALIFLLALAVRVWLWYDQGRAWMVFPGDQDEYYRGAIHLVLNGDYYDDGQWLRPPLTSFFFAGACVLFGINVPLALLLQCVVGATHPLLLAALSRRLFASERAGIAAALCGALFLPFATYASQLLSEQLFFYCITLALLLIEVARRTTGRQGDRETGKHETRDTRQGNWGRISGFGLSSFVFRPSSFILHPSSLWWFLSGVAWGLAALARPVGLYAVPLLVIWIVAENRIRREPHILPKRDIPVHLPRNHPSSFVLHPSSFILPAIAFLLGFVLVVGPWTARNYGVYKQLVIVDTNGGVSFWLGNLLTPEERELQQVWNATLSNSAIRQQVALERAEANILADPGLFIARMRYKAVSLWQLDLRLFAANDTRGVTIDESSVTFALVSDLEYVLLVVLALVGAWLAQPNERNWSVLGWPIYGTLLCAVTLGHPRLRVPLLVAAVAYAALPLAHPRLVWQRLRTASPFRLAGLLVSLVGFTLLLYAGALIPFVKGQFWLALRPLVGESAIQHALAVDPNGYYPHLALGDSRLRAGDSVGALAAYDEAAHRNPGNAPVQVRRINLLRASGDRAGAQAALADVAAVGWDNPQLYAWAWNAQPAPTVDRIDIAAPATGLLDGVYAAERDGSTTFRWTLDRVRMRLSAPGTTALHLRLRAPRPNTPVEVGEGGVVATTLMVGTDWQTYVVSLENLSSANNPPIELHAPVVVLSLDQPYPHGVAIADAYLSR